MDGTGGVKPYCASAGDERWRACARTHMSQPLLRCANAVAYSSGSQIMGWLPNEQASTVERVATPPIQHPRPHQKRLARKIHIIATAAALGALSEKAASIEHVVIAAAVRGVRPAQRWQVVAREKNPTFTLHIDSTACPPDTTNSWGCRQTAGHVMMLSMPAESSHRLRNPRAPHGRDSTRREGVRRILRKMATCRPARVELL